MSSETRTPAESSSGTIKSGQCQIVKDVCRHKIVPQLLKLFPDCGYFYLITNSLWPEDVYKIGRTNDLKRRFYSYNSSQPRDIIPKFIVICKDVKAVEDHVKARITPFLIDETRLEYVCMKEADLIAIIQQVVQRDAFLSADFGYPVYKLFDHDCLQCGPLAGKRGSLSPKSTVADTSMANKENHTVVEPALVTRSASLNLLATRNLSFVQLLERSPTSDCTRQGAVEPIPHVQAQLPKPKRGVHKPNKKVAKVKKPLKAKVPPQQETTADESLASPVPEPGSVACACTSLTPKAPVFASNRCRNKRKTRVNDAAAKTMMKRRA